MTKVYIIRHAEAEGNLYRRIHGHYDSNITETGMLQLEKLRERFEKIPIDAVYSSDLTRAQTTARAVSVPKRLEVITVPELREVDMGLWEDMTWGDVVIQWPEMLKNFTIDPDKWDIPGAESMSEVAERMSCAIKTLAARHDGGSIAVVTHGSASRTLFGHVLNIPSDRMMEVGASDNTAVSLLNVSGNNIEIEYKNDNSHLPHELSIFSRQNWHTKKNGDDDSNLRYAPIDAKFDKDRYLQYRSDAWMTVHGTMDGYSNDYYNLLLKHQKEYPMAAVTVYSKDNPIGLLELDVKTGHKEGYGSIAFYYLTEPYRYKGLGVQLLGQATSVYRSMGRDRLHLHVAEENTSARNFYAKYGFEAVGETRGSLGTLYIMEKDITLKIK